MKWIRKNSRIATVLRVTTCGLIVGWLGLTPVRAEDWGYDSLDLVGGSGYGGDMSQVETSAGFIWYRRILQSNPSTTGSVWHKFNDNGNWGKQWGFYGGLTWNNSDDVLFSDGIDAGGGIWGWGDPGNLNLDVQNGKSYIVSLFNDDDIIGGPGNNTAGLAVTEINHQSALVSFTSPSTSRSGNDINLDADNPAEASGSNEALWYKWTVDDFSTTTYVERETVAADETVSLPLAASGPKEGQTIKWQVISAADSLTGSTVGDTVSGVAKFDAAAINKSAVLAYTISDDDATGPVPSAFHVNGSTAASLTDGDLAVGGASLTGLVQDADSGLNVNGATVTGNDFSPNYDLLNDAGTVVLDNQLFDVIPLDGGASSSAEPLSETSLAALSPAQIDLGTYAVRVSLTDNDEDPTTSANDRSATLDSPVVTFTVADDDTACPVFTDFSIFGASGISTVSVAELSAGTGWSVTGLLHDADSGVNVNGSTTTLPDASPQVLLRDPSGAVRLTEVFDTISFADGGAASASAVSDSSHSAVGGTILLGTWTALVVAVDNDTDRGTADQLVCTNEIVFIVVGGKPAAPAGLTLSADGEQAVDLGWTANGAGDEVMVVRSASAGISTPSDGTAYGVGNNSLGGTVIYRGSAEAFKDTELTEGVAATYFLFSVNSGGAYSDELTGSITPPNTFGPGEIYDSFSYIDGDELDGKGGGVGFDATWQEGISGSFTIETNRFADSTGYPSQHGHRISVTPADGSSAYAERTFPAIACGTFYVAVRMSYQYGEAGDGSNFKYAGIRLCDGASEVGFVGEVGSAAATFGIDSFSGGSDTTSGFSPGTEYLVIGKYDFLTKTFSAIRYAGAATVPVNEPAFEVSAGGGTLSEIDGIRLVAGATVGSPGVVRFDECRMASSWGGLLLNGGPRMVDHAIGGSSSAVTDAEALAGTNEFRFTVVSSEGVDRAGTAVAGNHVPHFDIVSASGSSLVTDQAFDTVTTLGGGTSELVDVTHPLGSNDLVLGVYTAQVSVAASNGARMANARYDESEDCTSGTPYTTFTMVDDDDVAPVAALEYAGVNYLLGATNALQITDGDLVSAGGIDLAIRLDDASGLFVSDGSDNNFLSEAGNVNINYDFQSPSSSNLSIDALVDITDIYSDTNGTAAANGDPFVLVVIKDETNISYTANSTGTWQVAVSAQDHDMDRGVFSTNSDTVSRDRSVVTNQLLAFNVVDDDSTGPIIESMYVAYDGVNIDPDQGAGLTKLFTLTDGQLADVSASQLLSFSFEAYDESDLSRGDVGNLADLMNYDLGDDFSGGLAGLQNIFATYEASKSSDPATTNGSLSVFDHESAFNSTEIEHLYNSASNPVTISVVDGDNDRPDDRSRIENVVVGHFQVQDDDEDAPAVQLLYAGPSYTLGATNDLVVTDADLVSAAGIDFAYILTDESGLFVSDGSRNFLDTTGNVDPNYDLQRPDISDLNLNAFHDAADLYSNTNGGGVAAVNGDTEVVAIAYNVAVVNFAGNDTGTWHLSVSAQDFDNDRGAQTLYGDTVHSDRELLVNSNMSFKVIDDDVTRPTAPTSFTVDKTGWTNEGLYSLSWTQATDPADAETGVSSGILGYRFGLTAPTNAEHYQVAEAGTSMVYTQTVEGVSTGYLFAVDADNDRANDGLGSSNVVIEFKLDQTAPAEIVNLDAIEPTNAALGEMQITWDALLDAGGSDLSPLLSYRIYISDDDDAPTTNDLFYDYSDDAGLGNLATSDTLLTNLVPGLDYQVSITGRDQAGNEGPLSVPVAFQAPPFLLTNGWAVGEEEIRLRIRTKVSGRYDLLYVDAVDFGDSLSNQWQAINSRTNFSGDDGDADDKYTITNEVFGSGGSTPPTGDNIRFYRAAPHNRWKNGAGKKLVSAEVYLADPVFLAGNGKQNWVAMPGIPDTNTLDYVFGTGTLPAGANVANSSVIEWYARGNSSVPTQQVCLTVSGWQYSLPVSKAGMPAGKASLPLDQGFIVELPPGSPDVTSCLVGRVPTEPQVQTLKGRGSHNLVSCRVPASMHPSEMFEVDNDPASGKLTGGVLPLDNPIFGSDMVWKYDREAQQVSAVAYYSSVENKWLLDSGQPVPDNFFKSDDGIVVYTPRSTSDITWTNGVPYTPPTIRLKP